MAIGVIFNFPGGTTEQYDEVCRGLNNGQPMRSLADWPGGGCLSHAAPSPHQHGGDHRHDCPPHRAQPPTAW